MKRLMIVDALNQFLRGYIVDPSKNHNGQPIGGMRTFINILNKITREIKPDMIVVAWDGQGGSQKRKAMNKNYKEGRKPLRVNWSTEEMTPQDTDNNKLWQQLRTVDYLNQTPIIQFMEPAVEADDVISYIKLSPMFKEWEKVIVSADKDFIQLLDDKTLLYRPTQSQVLNKNKVLNEYKIHPTNFAMARAMAGDPSDNLKGIPGVGLATVAKRFPFMSSSNSVMVHDIVNHSVDNMDELRVYEKVLDYIDLIEENYAIMQLSSPPLSPQAKKRIDETFEGFTPIYKQTEMRKLMIQDGVLTVNLQSLEQKFNDIISTFS